MRNPTYYPLAATLAVQMLVSMASVTVPVLAPEAAREVGVSAGYVGLFVALVYLAGMASGLVSGALVQRIGPIRVSQYCLLICAVGLWLTATGVLPLLLLGAVLIGCGYGPCTPASSHILSHSTPPERMALIFSLKQTGVPLGGALAGAILPSVVLVANWRAAAVFVGIACIVVAAIVQPIRAGLDGQRVPHYPIGGASISGPMRLILGDIGMRRLAIASFFFASVQLCLGTYLVTYLTLQLGYSLVQAGLMLAFAQSAGVVGRIVWGAVADRGNPVHVVGALGVCIAVLAAVTSAFTPSWPTAFIALVCAAFGATAIGWNGVYLAQIARFAPAGRAGEATGGALFFTYFGVLAGPPVFAFMVEGGMSYSTAYVVVAIPSLISGLVLLFGGGRRSAVGAAAR
jgi:MFS family permease